MSSPQRLHAPGLRHFVTFSTYKRRKYLTPERTRDIVLEVPQKVLEDHRTACAGFVIMPDHVHAILFANGDVEFDVSAIVQVWKKTSSYRIRRFYAREFRSYEDSCQDADAIWQPGFHDSLVGDADHNSKLEYMHNNPVKARLVDFSISWNWSSMRFYELGEGVGVEITY